MSNKQLYGPDNQPLKNEHEQPPLPVQLSREQEASLAGVVAATLARHNKFKWGVGWRVFLLIFAVVGFALGWGVWSAIDFMKSAITKQFKEPRIQRTIVNVASNQAKELMLREIAPEVTRFRKEVGEMLSPIALQIQNMTNQLLALEGSTSELRDAADLAMKVLAASCDDRWAFDYLVHWRDLANKDQPMIRTAIDEILSKLAFNDSGMNPGRSLNWETVKVDPETASWDDYLKLWQSNQLQSPPRLLRCLFLEHLAAQTRFPREARLQLYYDLITTTPSLDVLHTVCRIVNNESKTNYSVLGVPRHLIWLGAELRPLIISNRTDVLRRNPGDAAAYAQRSAAYYWGAEFERAVTDMRSALRLNPKEGAYYNDLAWYLATCPMNSLRKGKEAVELARKACDLAEWKIANGVGTLAAAYAEAGDFEQAIKFQKQCIAMGRQSFTEREDRNRRLSLYEKHQPTYEKPKDY